ncbi:glutathione S-transferase family protein [Roseibium salinum]|uniref:Glutathione S-transferase n=1 Tax=Roseibium salinum TaxID=1604349 RepID=A0ABT3R354_9HYPH|nr:glutathione S-transferase [Roseibium sp. DSM 29163]MCX2723643.1 glutathione S-transferase [Roseibium sp. DSM 29163]MDN3718486.1 glutathione S-transferase [Roseibium salinum]
MAEYVLHCMAQSGHSYKVALMLELCGADWEPEWVDFFNGETRTEQFRDTLNEMGEVPVLIHGDAILTQSAVIMDYLFDRFGRFGCESDEERREVLRWTIFDNQKVSGMLGPLRFLRTLVKTGETEVTKWLDGRGRSALGILDKHFAGNEFAIGAKPTSADFSLCGYLFYDGELGIDLEPYPNVTKWLERIKALPGWKHPYDLMPGHPLPAAG